MMTMMMKRMTKMVKMKEGVTLDTMPKEHKEAAIKSLFSLTTLVANSLELPTKGFVTSDKQKKDVARVAYNVIALLETLPRTFGYKDMESFLNLCKDDDGDADDNKDAKDSGEGRE